MAIDPYPLSRELAVNMNRSLLKASALSFAAVACRGGRWSVAACVFSATWFCNVDGLAADLALTEKGQPTATIVLGEAPTISAQFAAYELQYHVEKITGATLPMATDGQPATGVRILVGESAATQALGFKSDDFAPQEYLVGFRDNAILLIGRDASLEDTATLRDRRKVTYGDLYTYPATLEANGSLYAVYDFLERHCGVRWYQATDLGICFTPTATLKVGGTDVRRAPHMTIRSGINTFPADLRGDTVRADPPMEGLHRHDMLLFEHRQRVGGEPYVGNHSFEGWYERFLKDHPDWFAQGYEGQGRPPQLCYTHPGVIAQTIQDARDYFDGKEPHKGTVAAGRFFALCPMDNANFCKCPRCRKLMHERPTRGVDSQFNTDMTSDYWFSFVNKVAREVAKTHPDKLISTLGYMTYAYPPKNARLEPNVSIQLTFSSTRHWNMPRQRTDEENLDAWVLESPDRLKVVRLWYCFPSLEAAQQDSRSALPGFFASLIPGRMREYVRAGVRGVYIEPAYINANGMGSALFDQIERYVTFKLADDPTLDGHALIEEFFDRYYGPAAAPMRRFYRTVERIWTVPRAAENPRQIVDEAIMKELSLNMEEAHRLAGSGVEKQRVDLFDRGVWQYIQAARKTFLEQEAQRAAPMQRLIVPAAAQRAAGNPSKVDWTKAAPLTGWRLINGGEASRTLAVRATHDGEHLYLWLTDPADGGAMTNDGGVWSGDDWEFFFARQRAVPYRQMGINPEGASICLAYGEADDVWTSRARVVSRTAAGEPWTVAVALPLADLLPGGVKPGDTVYMNIIRGIPGAEALAWVPTFNGFHEVGRLGELTLEAVR